MMVKATKASDSIGKEACAYRGKGEKHQTNKASALLVTKNIDYCLLGIVHLH